MRHKQRCKAIFQLTYREHNLDAFWVDLVVAFIGIRCEIGCIVIAWPKLNAKQTVSQTVSAQCQYAGEWINKILEFCCENKQCQTVINSSITLSGRGSALMLLCRYNRFFFGLSVPESQTKPNWKVHDFASLFASVVISLFVDIVAFFVVLLHIRI